MRRIIIALLYITLLPAPAHADARSVFSALNNCMLSSSPSKCRSMLTENSRGLFDRVAGYDVLRCLPKKTEYVSEQQAGSYTLVRAKTQLGNTQRFLKLAFTKGKLDIPYSLRMALGDNWEKQVNAVEAVYLMLRAQLGGKLNCDTVQGLAGGSSATTTR